MPGKCLRDVALRRLAGCEMGLTVESKEGALKDKTCRQNLPEENVLAQSMYIIFMSKCLEVLTGGRSMPGKCLRDMALGQLDGCEMGLTLESEEGEVPHLRWSQAPPLPWPRPGSADFNTSLCQTDKIEDIH